MVERRLVADADARPLVVLDPRDPPTPEALDSAVRAAASLAVYLARRAGGCSLLLPGDRRATSLQHDLRGWPALHARLALLEATDGGPNARRLERSGPVFWVSAGGSALPPTVKRGGRLVLHHPKSDRGPPRHLRRGRLQGLPAQRHAQEGGGVSGAAARLDTPLRTGSGKAGAAPATRVDENVAGLLRLGVFAAFATFSLAHWLSVIENPPVGRGLLVVLVCTLGGAALWATGLSPVPTRLAQIARPLIVLAMAVLSLLAAGLALHFLFPHGWHRLGPGLNRGLLGAQATIYPYTGGDPWVRLTLMLLGPLFLVPAAALAFWPAPRAGGVLRAASLVLLIGLFGMALAERTPSAQVGRGLGLLVLIAAWLWLPRLRGNDAVAAAAALAVAAVVALPLAGALDKSGGWFDYRNWRLFSAKGGVTYSWDQTYGPINWPRRGTTLLFVKSDRPYYWKAETLNSFDGTRWIGSTGNDGTSAASEIPIAPKRKWLKQLEVNISGLRGNLVVGAGTPYRISPDAGDTNTSADGTTISVGHELHSGEHYTVSTYLPEPTAAEMRAAPAPPRATTSATRRSTSPASRPGRRSP